MGLTTLSLIAFRLLCVAFVLLAPAAQSFAQSAEMEMVLFDDDLQTIPLTATTHPDLNIDILKQQLSPRWYTMFSELPNNYARSAGLTMRSESIPTLASLGILTFSLIQTDHQSYHATRHLYRESKAFREWSSYAVALGDGRLHAGIAAVFAGYGLFADDPKALRTASQTVEAFLATGLTVQLLKRVTGRESPVCATRRQGRWKFFPHPSTYNQNQPSYYAYPSGHISTAMATLTVIAENYPNERWIKPVGYSLIGALGVGLVSNGMHWYSDLPLGIALGYLFGKVASNPELGQFTETPVGNGVEVSVTPSFDVRGGSGVRLAINF